MDLRTRSVSVPTLATTGLVLFAAETLKYEISVKIVFLQHYKLQHHALRASGSVVLSPSTYSRVLS